MCNYVVSHKELLCRFGIKKAIVSDGDLKTSKIVNQAKYDQILPNAVIFTIKDS